MEGIETEIFHIGNGPMKGCIGCGKCGQLNHCVFDDDNVNVVLEKMKKSDGLVIGSPVYFASPNGSLLSFLDRLFYAGKDFNHKPAAVVASARRAGTTATLDVLSKYLMIRNMPVVSSTYWNMVHGSKPEDVQFDKEGLQTMRNVGKNMAWLCKCIALGEKQGISKPAIEKKERTNFIR